MCHTLVSLILAFLDLPFLVSFLYRIYPSFKSDFLNFSKDYLITGTNIIGDLLFFTDNLNQPRKININTAIANTAYYNSEQKIHFLLNYYIFIIKSFLFFKINRKIKKFRLLK